MYCKFIEDFDISGQERAKKIRNCFTVRGKKCIDQPVFLDWFFPTLIYLKTLDFLERFFAAPVFCTCNFPLQSFI